MTAVTLPWASARDAFIKHANSSSAQVYAHPSFIEFLTRATTADAHVVIAKSGDEIAGMLPFLSLEAPDVGRVVNSLPWWGSHGGCILDAEREDANSIRIELLEQFKIEASGQDVLSATIILPHSEEAARLVYEATLSPEAVERRIGQITALPSPDNDENALMNTLTSKTRNLVRKSLKQNFVEQIRDDDASWDFLHRVHSENILALKGKPKPRAHFEAIRQTLPADMRRLSLALIGDKPVAAMLLLYGGGTVEYVTPAVEIEARSLQPLSFLIWCGMRDAIARGMLRWNWGGTWVDQHSLHHFKAGFGAKDFPYSYFILARPEGVSKLRTHRAQLGTLFPYFYTFPYALLDTPS